MTPARLPGTSPVKSVRPADAAGLLAALRVVASGTMVKPIARQRFAACWCCWFTSRALLAALQVMTSGSMAGSIAADAAGLNARTAGHSLLMLLSCWLHCR